MKAYYDFHIHSALSPCGENDMTPQNIVGLASLIGLDVIAVSDHNSVGNCAAVMEVGEQAGIVVIPAMELETSEEVHVLMLFSTLDGALACGEEVRAKQFAIANDESIYGSQFYLNADDEVLGKEEQLLVTATAIGAYEVAALAQKYGGVAIPAHIDRPSHGILQMLGDIDEYMGFTAVEISPNAGDEFVEGWQKRGYKVVRNSDAHQLDSINEKVNYLELDELTASAVIDKLKQL